MQRKVWPFFFCGDGDLGCKLRGTVGSGCVGHNFAHLISLSWGVNCTVQEGDLEIDALSPGGAAARSGKLR
jgi:hypothetical protein